MSDKEIQEGIAWEILQRRKERYGSVATQALDDIADIAYKGKKSLTEDDHLDEDRAKDYALNVAAACVAAMELL